jgi:hypothetical protein
MADSRLTGLRISGIIRVQGTATLPRNRKFKAHLSQQFPVLASVGSLTVPGLVALVAKVQGYYSITGGRVSDDKREALPADAFEPVAYVDD